MKNVENTEARKWKMTKIMNAHKTSIDFWYAVLHNTTYFFVCLMSSRKVKTSKESVIWFLKTTTKEKKNHQTKFPHNMHN